MAIGPTDALRTLNILHTGEGNFRSTIKHDSTLESSSLPHRNSLDKSTSDHVKGPTHAGSTRISVCTGVAIPARWTHERSSAVGASFFDWIPCRLGVGRWNPSNSGQTTNPKSCPSLLASTSRARCAGRQPAAEVTGSRTPRLCHWTLLPDPRVGPVGLWKGTLATETFQACQASRQEVRRKGEPRNDLELERISPNSLSKKATGSGLHSRSCQLQGSRGWSSASAKGTPEASHSMLELVQEKTRTWAGLHSERVWHGTPSV